MSQKILRAQPTRGEHETTEDDSKHFNVISIYSTLHQNFQTNCPILLVLLLAASPDFAQVVYLIKMS